MLLCLLGYQQRPWHNDIDLVRLNLGNAESCDQIEGKSGQITGIFMPAGASSGKIVANYDLISANIETIGVKELPVWSFVLIVVRFGPIGGNSVVIGAR